MIFLVLLKYILSLNHMKRAHFLLRILFLLAFSLLLFDCNKEKDSEKVPDEKEAEVSIETEAVLFIGNSHTYFNSGIASHLASFRSLDNLDFTPIISEVAKGGYTLNDHLNDSETIDKINERSWDVMILQENSSVAAEELEETIEAAVALNDLVIRKGTKVLLFMTWPYEDEPQMLAAIKRTYTKSATAIDATIVPIGEDWGSINFENPHNINLYAEDGVHPSLEGTYFATAKFYRAIYDKLPSSNSYQAGLSPIVATYLKEQAD